LRKDEMKDKRLLGWVDPFFDIWRLNSFHKAGTVLDALLIIEYSLGLGWAGRFGEIFVPHY
jgi:hypothetical protein